MPSAAPSSEALPAARQPSGPYRICVVCLGNICRSPMAEFVLRTELAHAGLDGRAEVDSAGTGDWHVGERMYAPALAELTRRGYDGSTHRARQIQGSWLARYDLVLAMDRSNLADLRGLAPEVFVEGRIRLLRSFAAGTGTDDGEVPDPYGGPPAGSALAFDLVQAAARGLTAELAEFLGVRAPGRQ